MAMKHLPNILKLPKRIFSNALKFSVQVSVIILSKCLLFYFLSSTHLKRIRREMNR